ncbi:hypothetical protein ACHQM5_003486 [Ranunculus cassubicifolius]
MMSKKQNQTNPNPSSSSNTVSSVARSLLPTWRRLRLDPSSKLYFPYEPGKQVRSAVRIKFQTTAPKSCFMRPPGGILAPGESIIATVFKFVEHPENNEKQSDQRSKVKFKIMSLKVTEGMDYVPELTPLVGNNTSIVFLEHLQPSPSSSPVWLRMSDTSSTSSTVIESPPPPPVPFEEDEDVALVNAWTVKEMTNRGRERERLEDGGSVVEVLEDGVN